MEEFLIKKYNLLVIVFLSTFLNSVFAYEFGLSSSGKDISLDFWSDGSDYSETGFYFRLIIDSDEYHNGDLVNVCRDGSVSGSFGSGSCSNHGGVSHSKFAEFDRMAFAIGPTYWVSKNIQLHGGLLWAMYTSDINVGDEGKLNFDEFGVDLGISIKMFDKHNMTLVVSHETEQKRNLLGIRMSF